MQRSHELLVHTLMLDMRHGHACLGSCRVCARLWCQHTLRSRRDSRQLVQFPPDVVTKPGQGLGIYSPGQHALVAMYAHTARAALVVARGNASAAAQELQSALLSVKGLGYTEPPRALHRLRPCLSAVLLRVGRTVEARAAAMQDLREDPRNAWGQAALLATMRNPVVHDASSADDTGAAQVAGRLVEPGSGLSVGSRRREVEACMLLFGARDP